MGRHILKAAAESNLKKVTLELGGKSPTLILDDSNLDDAIKWAAFGIAYVLPLPSPLLRSHSLLLIALVFSVLIGCCVMKQ